MVKIGFVGGKLYEVVSLHPYRKWMDHLNPNDIEDECTEIEKAYVASINHKYKDAECVFIDRFDERLLQKNDVNFLVGQNILNAFQNNKTLYQKQLQIMKNPKNNIYPPHKEQQFLFHKGKYHEYFMKRGIPMAPTFIIRKDRNVNKIIQKIKNKGWKSFVLKPEYAYANIKVVKFDINENNLEKKVQKYLNETKKYPGWVCQETMIGFRKYWELKTFWINGEYKYHLAIIADVFDNEEQFGKAPKKLIDQIKPMAKKIIKEFPKTKIKGKEIIPPMLRLDFGCCLGNTLDKSKYFFTEMEYCGCGTFVDYNPTYLKFYTDVYYQKAKEIQSLKKNKSLKK